MSFLENQALNEDNIGGGIYLLLASVNWIDVFPDVINHNIEDEVTFLPGYDFQRWDFTQETINFSDEFIEQERGADGYLKTITAIIPKDRIDLQQRLHDSRIDRCVCIYVDANGTAKCIGTKETPAKLIIPKLDHKQSAAERNEYEILITLNHKDPAPFYNATLPEGSGLPFGYVEIKNIDTGAVIATVAAPGEYEVEVLTEITDTIDSNTSTIIDPIS